MLKKSLSILILTLIILTSCKKTLPDIGGTAAQPIANEWWVSLFSGTTNLYGTGHYFKLATYNTAANTNEIWVDDEHNIYDFKVKAQADFNALTFNASKAQNEYYAITVDIANGKVLTNAAHSKSGNIVDSIYMEAKFSDDPTSTYIIKGTARTMLIEDDY